MCPVAHRGWTVLSAAAALAVGAAVWLHGCGDGGLGSAGNNTNNGASPPKAVKINGTLWMAENLNIETGKSWCYDNKKSNCGKYGRLYDWKTATTACPAGWHLPAGYEWNNLKTAVGEGAAGRKLKSKNGWHNDGNGTDSVGFSALPGGYRSPGGVFLHAGDYGGWWTATEHDNDGAYYRYMDYGLDYVGEGGNLRTNAFSVRCVAD
jgi:uncharacterized protein (TIGR02145 family)